MNIGYPSDIIRPADILLPRAGVELERFSVIACDQHTSDPAYWEAVAREAGDAPSALRLILPEIYLEELDSRLPAMHAAMRAYARDVLERAVSGFVYVKRQTTGGLRRGLVAALDLDAYCFDAVSDAPVRATEGVVAERLPARVRIRDGAPLELPHALVLFSDPADALFSALDARPRLRPLYAFELMRGGGHIEGCAVEAQGDIALVLDALRKSAVGGMTLAVGDGNHSLAAAKALWDERKKGLSDAERAMNPLRFALVELCNLYDPSLRFEAIHRVLYNVDACDVLSHFNARVGGEGAHAFECAHAGRRRTVALPATHALPVGTLQNFLDRYAAAHPGAYMDYIHGEDECLALAEKPGAVAFLLPAMDKALLFPAVLSDGALPRKTFSMGHARDKRYYLEARALSTREAQETRERKRGSAPLDSPTDAAHPGTGEGMYNPALPPSVNHLGLTTVPSPAVGARIARPPSANRHGLSAVPFPL